MESIYPIIYFDRIVLKTRKDIQITNKCVYSVLGAEMEGQKDILGIWISENESSSFYASICSDLKKRGISEIVIAGHDNLKGRGDAINAVFPKTKQQLCIVHQIRKLGLFLVMVHEFEIELHDVIFREFLEVSKNSFKVSFLCCLII